MQLPPPRFYLILVVGLFLASPATAQRVDRDNAIAKTDALFTDFARAPGCAVGVIDDGALVFAKGYGIANLDYNVPLSPQSVFSLGSLAKQFTGAAVALLALRGELSLDDDVRTYVPELPEYEHAITIRHLLHHTSGIRGLFILRDLAGQSPDDFFDNDDTIELLTRQRALNFDPGSEYRYSNSGYVVLAEIVERASGQTFEEFSREHLFDPLGMQATAWGYDRQQVIPNRVVGYTRRPDGSYEQWGIGNVMGVGPSNLRSSVKDLYLWDQMFYDTTDAWRPLIELMYTRGVLNNGDTLSYAFGLQHRQYRGRRTVGHGGGVPGFRSFITRFPDDRFTTIILCNGRGLGWERLADIWLFGDEQPVTAGADSIDTPEPITLPPETVNRLAGTYWNLEEHEPGVEIRPEGNGLRVNALGGFSTMLLPVSPTVFYVVDVSLRRDIKQFEFKQENDTVVLEFSILGRPRRLPRIELPQLSVEQLAEFTGDYHSAALDATWTVWLEDDTLRIKGRYWDRACLPCRDRLEGRGRLTAVGGDQFSHRRLTLHFSRGAGDQVTGFAVYRYPDLGIQFLRVQTP